MSSADVENARVLRCNRNFLDRNDEKERNHGNENRQTRGNHCSWEMGEKDGKEWIDCLGVSTTLRVRPFPYTSALLSDAKISDALWAFWLGAVTQLDSRDHRPGIFVIKRDHTHVHTYAQTHTRSSQPPLKRVY